MSQVSSFASRFARWRWRDGAIFALAAAVGGLFFLLYFKGQVGRAGDTPIYVEMSRGVFSGRGFQIDGNPTATYPPGYPIFLAPFVAAFGGAGRAVVLVQILLGGACAVAVARLGERIYSRGVGALAGLLAALSPQLAFWEAYPISDLLGLVFLLWGMTALFSSAPNGGARDRRPALIRAAVGGALFGLAALVRPLSLSLALPALAWFTYRSLDISWRRRVSLACAALVALALVISPWAVRNSVEFGGFYPLSTRNGWQLIQATEWEVHGRGTVGVDVHYPDEASGLSEAEADRVLTRIALERIRTHPGDFLRRSMTKVLYMWSPTAPGLGLGSLIFGLWFCLVAAASAIAMLFRTGRRGGVLWLATAGAAIGIALTILDPDFRYRLPVLMVLIPPAAWLAAKAAHMIGLRGVGDSDEELPPSAQA